MYFNFSNGYPPLQFFMQHGKGFGNKHQTAFENMTAYYDAFTNLCDLFLNTFEWHNLPTTCNERMLETSLLFNGNCLFFKHKENGGFFHSPFTFDGSKLDFYGQPTNYITSAPTYTGHVYDADNSVVIRASRMQYPMWIALDMYARRLSDTLRSIDVVQQTMKRPFVVLGDKDAEVTIREIFYQQQSNEMYIVKNKNAMKNVDYKLFPIPQSADNLTALWDNLNNLYSETYKRMGIKSATKDKAERMVVSEATSSWESVESNINFMLDSRLAACDAINERWGLNLSVSLKHSYDENVEVKDVINNTE